MIRRDAWEDAELQTLYDLVNDIDWLDTARRQLPRRSDAAILTKMCLLRREAGIIPTRGPKAKAPSAVTREAAAEGCAMLKRALEAVHG